MYAAPVRDDDQARLVGLVRDLFSQPYEHVINNDLPLDQPVDFNWTDPGGGAFRLRLYVGPQSVLVVKERAVTPSGVWSWEERVLVHGNEAVKVASELKRLLLHA